MDKLLLKKAAIQSVALMLAVVTLSYALNQYETVTISASNMAASDDSLSSMDVSTASETGLTTSNLNIPLLPDNLFEVNNEEAERQVITQYLEDVDLDIIKQMGKRYLVVKKPLETNIAVRLDDLYVTKTLQIKLTGLDGEDMNSQMITRVFEDEVFMGEPVFTETMSPDTDTTDDLVITRDYGNDFVHGVTITNQYDNVNKNYTTDLLIELDDVYATILYEDEEYYYINLKDPKEVYEKILVIDAGHGGKDAGALSWGEQYYEKDINLAILLQLKELLDRENIKVYYTRTADDKVFLRPRFSLANSVDCDFFISIHCNANEVSWPNGSEVFYYDTEFKGVKAKDLANLFLDELAKTISLKKNEVMLKQNKEIYILHNAVVPAILIEVGYLTNNKDMEYLSKEENRKAVAQGIFNGIMKAYEMYPVTDNGL